MIERAEDKLNRHSMKVIGYYIIVTGVSFVIPLVSSMLLNHIQRANESLNQPARTLIYYVIQLILGTLVYIWMTGEWNFKIAELSKDLKDKVKWVGVYLSVFLVIVVAFYALSHVFNDDFLSYANSWWMLDRTVFIDTILTTCLQAGIFEEPFFRGIIAVLILRGIGLTYDGMKPSMKVCLVICNGALFSLAHVYYEVFPFRVLPLDYTQLLATFFVGCVMTHYYYKTRNIIGPILAHTGGNIIQVLVGYGYVFIMSQQ